MKLSEIKETAWAEKPVGWYHVVISDMVDSYTKEKGTPKTNVDTIILDGAFKGHHLFTTVWRTEKALSFLKPFLIACGFTENDDIDVEDGEVKLYETQLKGKQLMMYVSGHQAYTDSSGNERKREIISQYKMVDVVLETGDIEIPF